MHHWFWAVGYAMIGAFLGASLDLTRHGLGIATLILTLLMSALGVRRTALAEPGADRHTQMALAMAGMLVGALVGLVGTAAALFTAHTGDTMTWSMILMAGSMGGMIGGALGPYIVVVVLLRLGRYRIEL